LVTSSPRYPESNGLAESAVRTVKRLWQKGTDKISALLAYRSTPLPSGYSPNELMFGRSVRSNLGLPFVDQIDYADYERKEIDRAKNRADKWNKKYRTKKLPDLQPNDLVWVNSLTDLGKQGVVVRKDTTPESYWVQVDSKVIRRNRKHLFLLANPGSKNSSGSIDDSRGCLIDVTSNNSNETNSSSSSSDCNSSEEGNGDVVDNPLDTPDSQHLDLPIANDTIDSELFPPEQGEISHTRWGRLSKPPNRLNMHRYK